MEDHKIGLSVYLLRPEKVKDFESNLKKPGTDVRPLASPLDGEFISLPSEPDEPGWVGAVRSALYNPDGLTLEAQTPGGLMVLRQGTNTFVVAFGHAWHRLKDKWLESDFGLRVALNSIPPDKLIEIRAEQVFAKRHIASERAPRASLVDEFGVEFDRDLVASMQGIPSVKLFGEHLRGGTSLRVDLPISELEAVLDKAAKLFASTEYKKRWPEVGNITPIRDSDLIAKLEAQLDTEFASGQAQKKLVLFTPSQRRNEEPEVAQSFVFGRLSKNSATTPYLLVGSWLSFLKEKGLSLSVEAARETTIHLLNEAKELIKDCNAFDCLCYELTLGGKLFILSSGVWYEVVSDFIKRVNQSIANIGEPPLSLPEWDHAESEAAYNKRCAKPAGFLHFDCANVIFGGGQSKFEFCDFLHQKTKALFFAKIASKSSGMSHLFEQVRRTEELLFSTDGTFREELKKVFAKYHPKTDAEWLNSRPFNGDWNMCMVSLGREKDELPFFAKCGLWRLNKDLTERGHVVSFKAV